MNLDNISQIVINIIFVYSFIMIFYFSYVIGTVKKSFKMQINVLVDDIFSDFKETISDSLQGQDKTTIFAIKESIDLIVQKYEPQLVTLDTKFYNKLNSIRNSFIYTSYGLIIYILFVAGLLYYFKNYNIFNMISNSFLAVLFVIIFEFLIINMITSQYISIDPSKIKKDLYKRIYDLL
jgi:hypothetical protein